MGWVFLFRATLVTLLDLLEVRDLKLNRLIKVGVHLIKLTMHDGKELLVQVEEGKEELMRVHVPNFGTIGPQNFLGCKGICMPF